MLLFIVLIQVVQTFNADERRESNTDIHIPYLKNTILLNGVYKKVREIIQKFCGGKYEKKDQDSAGTHSDIFFTYRISGIS